MQVIMLLQWIAEEKMFEFVVKSLGPAKNSVNSTTVIKNDIVERLEKQPLNFYSIKINTVIC